MYPGASTGSTQVYEDDGETVAYLDSSNVAWTSCNYSRSSATAITLTISTTGHFSQLPSTRTHIVRLVASMPLVSVTANGANVAYARWGGANTWTYDGVRMEAVIEVSNVAVATPLVVVVTTAAVPSGAVVPGIRGSINHAVWAKAGMDETAITPGTNQLSPAYVWVWA